MTHFDLKCASDGLFIVRRKVRGRRPGVTVLPVTPNNDGRMDGVTVSENGGRSKELVLPFQIRVGGNLLPKNVVFVNLAIVDDWRRPDSSVWVFCLWCCISQGIRFPFKVYTTESRNFCPL